MTDSKFEYYKKRLKKIHGDKYTIPNWSRPNTVRDKFILVCKKHGEFTSTFDALLNKKSGCPACAGRKIPTNDEFIERCNKVHAGKNYDFSSVKYVNSKTKVTVICREKWRNGEEHGPFEIRASHLVSGVGCPKCSGRETTQNEWVLKAKEIHGDKYDYSESKYIASSEKIKIICHKKDENGNEHGPFYQVASSHLSGCGCPKCNGGISMSAEDFIERAKKIHNNRYDYSKVNYKNANTPVEIVCPRHGSFLQTPYQHTIGRGCLKCKSSKLESMLIRRLDEAKIQYEYQVYFNGLGNQTIDFFVPTAGTYIECQGEQHFKDTCFSKNEEHVSEYKERVYLDKLKYNAVKSNGFEMLYYAVPNYFHNTGVKPNYEFYEDKLLFTDINLLMNKIEELIKTHGPITGGIIDAFYSELKKINPGFIKSGNKFMFNDVVIFFNAIKENESTTIASRRKSFKRGNRRVYDIFEDEYIEHHDVVMSKIKHILNMDNDLPKVPGRKCKICTISNYDAEWFLNKYHIQGFASSSVYVGAYYNGKLIGIMTFLNDGNGKWNLNRFATDTSCICQGVGGKLFKWFIKKYNPIEIKSFADRRWTFDKDDNFYTKVGFVYDSRLSSDYKYFKPGEKVRYHKFSFRKKILSKKYGFPMTMTENEMTKKAGYSRIYDAGLYKFIWKKK